MKKVQVSCPKCGCVFTADAPDFDVKYQCLCPGGGGAAPHYILLGDTGAPSGSSPCPVQARGAKAMWRVCIGTEVRELTSGNYTIGRYEPTEKSDIMIEDSYASARVARIDVEGVRARLVMLRKPSNKMWLNGLTALEAGMEVPLNSGDSVRFGTTEVIFTTV